MSLQLIRGQVTDLAVTTGSLDPVFGDIHKGIAGIGAVAAAATGQLLSSTILTNASHAAKIDLEFFTCVVNDLRLFGHLHKVEFNNGDEMDFVVERWLGRGSVQSARGPAHRLIWMRPYQTRGTKAQQKNNRKWRYVASFLCAATLWTCPRSAGKRRENCGESGRHRQSLFNHGASTTSAEPKLLTLIVRLGMSLAKAGALRDKGK